MRKVIVEAEALDGYLTKDDITNLNQMNEQIFVFGKELRRKKRSGEDENN